MSPAGKAGVLFSAAQQRAKAKNLKFTLTREWIEARLEAGACEITGEAFHFGPPEKGHSHNPYAPSLDRINTKAGYTPKNCRVVLFMVNTAMNAFGEFQFEYISKCFLEKLGYTIIEPGVSPAELFSSHESSQSESAHDEHRTPERQEYSRHSPKDSARPTDQKAGLHKRKRRQLRERSRVKKQQRRQRKSGRKRQQPRSTQKRPSHASSRPSPVDRLAA